VRLKVDVIVTVGGAVLAAKQATSVIPIVFAVAADPVSSGLVGSLARPGGNVTGLSLQQTDAACKRLGLFRDVLPDFRRLAIMANVGYPAAVLDMNEVQVAARKLGLEVVDKLEIRKAEDVAPAFDALKGGAQALYVCGDPLVDAVRARINTLALGARLTREGRMTVTIGRRELITALGGAAAAWPLAARAQQGERTRHIGVLTNLAENDPEGQVRHAAFLKGLQELGWLEGRNLRVESRWTGGDTSRGQKY